MIFINLSKSEILSIIKYIISIFISIFLYYKVGIVRNLYGQLLEILLVFFLCQLINCKLIRALVCDILLLIINVQMLVYYFGNTYLTLLMISNIVSIQDLKGNAAIYFGGALFSIIIALMPSDPIRRLQRHKIKLWVITLILLTTALISMKKFGGEFLPILSLSKIPVQAYNQYRQYSELIGLTSDAEEMFFKVEVDNYIKQPQNLKNKPNIILIFTEGLSQNIVEDNRKVMPNLGDYYNKSIVFSNYYNHTAATYRGIVGQLYSGYEMKDADANKLVSLQEILTNSGYHSVFINTEPNNLMFSNYLQSFGFKQLLGGESKPYNGSYYTDKEAYLKLWETIENNSSKEPYFICIYTFGTHATFNSEDEIFGDGTCSELNKFYNADYQFGEFMKKFENSNLTDDTLLIITADHATVNDAGFSEGFPDYQREAWFTDRIPFLIYYKGVNPEIIDAAGRNSLDLAPTILDYLDISGPNYFLGKSLFAPKDQAGFIETIYNETVHFKCTDSGVIDDLSDEELKKVSEILKYYYSLSLYYEK